MMRGPLAAFCGPLSFATCRAHLQEAGKTVNEHAVLDSSGDVSFLERSDIVPGGGNSDTTSPASVCHNVLDCGVVIHIIFPMMSNV